MNDNYRPEGLFEVAQKVFVRKGPDILILTNSRFGAAGDVPGGRLSLTDSLFDLRAALQREILEELGADVVLEISDEPLFMSPYTSNEGKIEVLGFWYTAKYLGGEIQLSEEHSEVKWMDPQNAVPLFEGHFKIGLEKYLALGAPT